MRAMNVPLDITNRHLSFQHERTGHGHSGSTTRVNEPRDLNARYAIGSEEAGVTMQCRHKAPRTVAEASGG